jgi:hypothetical protein
MYAVVCGVPKVVLIRCFGNPGPSLSQKIFFLLMGLSQGLLIRGPFDGSICSLSRTAATDREING